jgi:competence CoiA-like predicted nuclease
MKGHRAKGGALGFGPRVTLVHGNITKTTTQMLCDKCGEPVILKGGRWVHGAEA